MQPSSAGTSSSAAAIDPSTLLKHSHQNMCQSLINNVASQAKEPTVNHTLKRAFGPAMEALCGSDIVCV